jgi:RNA polymerase sigma factor (sigma-70 family)
MSGVVRPMEKATKEQKALIRSVPGLAEKAVRHVRKAWGTGGLDRDDLVQIAHLGIFRAAQSYDASKGPFAGWAFYKASHAVRDAVRQALGPRKPLDAAREAAETNYLCATTVPADDDPSEPPQASFRHMVQFAEDLLLAEMEGVMGAMDALSPEEAVMAKQEWEVAFAALSTSVPDVKPERLDLLKKHYGEGLNLKQTAAAQGLSYWTILSRHEETLDLLRARLRGQGVTEMPSAGAGEAWGSLFEGVPALG